MSMPVQYVTGKRVTTCSRCGFKVEDPVLLSMIPGAAPFSFAAYPPDGWHVIDRGYVCSPACLLAVATDIAKAER